MKRKLRASTAVSAPNAPGPSSQDRDHHNWLFCRICRAKVNASHRETCGGKVYRMDGYVQIPRKHANERMWRLWILRFCQPFRLIS